jgi:Na+/H+ antiporter NhaD/arsenite permease-like protein
LRASQRHGLAPGRLAISAALTANAASFLLPTSNITNLLLLGREHLPATAYIAGSWLPWLLVTVVTVGPLGVWSAAARGHARPVDARLSAGMLADLPALYLIASGVRALLGTALALHGNFAGQLAYGSVIAAVAGNLPAAAAMLPPGTAGLWAAVLAAAIGPNLLITGSVATLISRRIAARGGARLSAWQFSAIGLVLVPAQFAVAALGLHIAGVLR